MSSNNHPFSQQQQNRRQSQTASNAARLAFQRSRANSNAQQQLQLQLQQQQQQQQQLNVHSRASIRELQQARGAKQPAGNASSVLDDLGHLHNQNSKDIHAVFVSTPIESITGSAYVSGHLTPSDQWVAVGSESSGVISLTSSDNEDEYEDASKSKNSGFRDPSIATSTSDNTSATNEHSSSYSHRQPNDKSKSMGKQPQQRPDRDSADTHYQQGHDQWHSGQPMQMQHPALYGTSGQTGNDSRWEDEQDLETEKAVHLLRESVASLLSSSGNSGASSVASAQASISTGGISRRDQRTGIRHRSLGPAYRPTRSPSSLSKISEPCYPPSAPRRKFAPNLDHFSDITLSSNSTPPFASLPLVNQHHQQTPATQFPTYDEFKQQQQQQQQQHSVPAVTSALVDNRATDGLAARKRANTADTFDSFADIVAHPLLADVADHNKPLAAESSLYSAATRSPFASIMTLSPVVVTEKDSGPSNDHRSSPELVNKARAAAALEQAIHCPMRLLKKQSACLAR
ncbi:hypothetical protein FB639_001106 [Coemansia asiatica]|nr:hypothetical protein FB639_001106 [Coemansia asiatica]